MYSRKLSVCLLVALFCFMVSAQENTSSQPLGTPAGSVVQAKGSPEAKPSPSPPCPPEDVGKLKEDVKKLEALTDDLGTKLWNAIIITSVLAFVLFVLLIVLFTKNFATTRELQTELAPLNSAVAQLKKTVGFFLFGELLSQNR